MAGKSKDLMRFAKHITPGIGRLSEMIVVKGRGSYLYTDCGEKLLDFATGIGVTNVGACHPKVTQAVQHQAAMYMHGQVNISYQDRMLELISKMLPILPTEGNKAGDSPLDSFFFWNSGADAVESALKLARHATKRPNFIVFQGSYHGRTFGTMPLTTSKSVFSAGFGPFMGGIHTAPFPYCAHCKVGCPFGKDCCGAPIEGLENMLRSQCAPEDTAAMIVEPVQGEGGYVMPPPSFLPQLREICDKHGILLIFDEVQTGVGRTGKMWACQHSGVVPDVLVFAKGIASGLPLSGIVTRQELANHQPPGSMGGTYAGNAVACAAACATLDVFEEEKVLENVAKRATQLREGLIRISGGSDGKIGTRFPILDIRGPGLMVGLELDQPAGSGAAAAVSKACLKRGMLLLTTSTFETVRFIPALNMSKADMDKGLAIFEQAMLDVFPAVGGG